MASGDLKPPGPGRGLGEFRSRVGSSSGHGLSRPLIDKAAIRDRVVSGPVHPGGHDGQRRLRTESGGGRGGLETEVGGRPLVQTLTTEAGAGVLGSQDSVFSDRGLASVSNIESQVSEERDEARCHVETIAMLVRLSCARKTVFYPYVDLYFLLTNTF